MNCFDGILRTGKYLRAVYQAITDLTQEQKTPLEIVYAGCGPLGALISPLLTLFTKEQIQVTFIDIHHT
jgi:hypothetical protein